MLKEFKTFAMRGNMIDLAVGIIIGAAFGKIIASLVSDVIMPPLGLIIGGINFTDLSIMLKEAVTEPATGKVLHEAVSIRIGNFIQTLVDFTIIAFAIFLLIKAINRASSKEKETPASAPPPPTPEQELLTEIRDLLKNQKLN